LPGRFPSCWHAILPGRYSPYLPNILTRQQLAIMQAQGPRMDDNYDFRTKALRPLSEGVVGSIVSAAVHADPEPVHAVTETDEQPTPSRQVGRKSKAPQSTREDFTGRPAPLQVKIPTDMIQSLNLHSISTGKTMSELVIDCITSPQMLGKAWISTRKAV